MVAAIALPVAVAAGASTLRATSESPVGERVAASLGQTESILINADLVVERGASGALEAGPQEVRAATGRAVELSPELSGPLAVEAGGRQAAATGYGIDLDDPIHRGKFALVDGRPARDAGEVAVSVAVAERLTLQVGDGVHLGDARHVSRVTGIIAQVSDISRQIAISSPSEAGDMLGPRNRADDEASPGLREEVVPGAESVVVVWHSRQHVGASEQLFTRGWDVQHRAAAVMMAEDEIAESQGRLRPWIAAIAVFVLAELGIILSAVYAIVVRSSRRELALLGVAGAGPRTRRKVIVAHGAGIGLMATAVGLATGVLVARALAPAVLAGSDQLFTTLRIDGPALAAIAVLAVATPVLASMVAARGIGTDLLASLRDLPDTARRTAGRRATVVVAVVGVGAVLGGGSARAPFLVAGGAVLTVLAAGSASRWALGWTPAGHRWSRMLPLLAWRSLGRVPGRTAALATVVASITVVGGLTMVGLGGFAAYADEHYVPYLPDGAGLIYTTRMPQPATIDELERTLGVERIVGLGIATPPAPSVPAPDGSAFTYWGDYQVTFPACPADGGGCAEAIPADHHVAQIMVTDADGIDRVLGRTTTDSERRALHEGAALVLDPTLAPGGRVTATAPDPEKVNSSAPYDDPLVHELPAVAGSARSPYLGLPTTFVTPNALDALDGTVQPNFTYLYVPPDGQELTPEREDRARAVLAADISASTFLFEVERGSPAAGTLRTGLVAFSTLLAIVSSSLSVLSVALATQELRPDLSALAVAGATRSFRRRLGAAYAAAVTIVGLGIGILATALATPSLLNALALPSTSLPWLGVVLAITSALAAATAAGLLAGGLTVTTNARVR